MNFKKLFIPFVLAGFALGIFSYFFIHHQQVCLKCINLKTFTPEVVKHFIESFGPWAIVVYIALYTINTVSLLPPIAIMSLSAGFLFGPVKGLIALTLGAFFGTTATFYISRYFGGGIVDRLAKSEKARHFQEELGKRGFFVILPIRLIGFPPWELVNYVSGLSKISYRDYIAATMIGIFPAIVVQVFFSDRISEFNLKDPTLYMAVGAFVLLAVVPTMILNARKKRKEKNNQAVSAQGEK